MNTAIIAHRGASYLANHENTIEAYQLALDVHADCIEFDVRQTLDKTLILFHDEAFGETPVKSMTYSELNGQAEALGYHIPTLEEALQLCQGKIRLLIELKEAGYERRVLTLVRAYYPYEAYAVQSFLDIVVRRVKRIDPEVRCGLLIGLEHAGLNVRFNEYFPVRRMKECRADFISVHYYLATLDFLFRMKRRQIPVYVWTVDEPRVIGRLLAAEADGVITNRPDVGLYLRTRYEREQAQTAEKRNRRYDLLRKTASYIPIHRSRR